MSPPFYVHCIILIYLHYHIVQRTYYRATMIVLEMYIIFGEWHRWETRAEEKWRKTKWGNKPTIGLFYIISSRIWVRKVSKVSISFTPHIVLIVRPRP